MTSNNGHISSNNGRYSNKSPEERYALAAKAIQKKYANEVLAVGTIAGDTLKQIWLDQAYVNQVQEAVVDMILAKVVLKHLPSEFTAKITLARGAVDDAIDRLGVALNIAMSENASQDKINEQLMRIECVIDGAIDKQYKSQQLSL